LDPVLNAPEILMGYQASRQSSTKHSPYYMLFQQQMRLPVDSEMLTSDEQAYDNKDKEDGEDVSKIIEQLLESRKKAFDRAECTSNVHKRSKRSCMTENISQMNYQMDHLYSWRTQLRSNAKGVNYAQHGLGHTPSTNIWEKECMS